MLEQTHTIARTGSRTGGHAGKRLLLSLLAVALVGLVASAWKFKVTGQPPFLHRENVWSVAIYEGESPLHLRPRAADNRPILTAEDVTDIDALFVADPFMVAEDDIWYLFVEVLNQTTHQGDIALAVSHDQGKTWSYRQVVLDEDWHLSYPSVFSWDGTWYMLPQGDSGVHLYHATEFPTQWQRCETLLAGTDLADPTVFRHDDTWWMFVGRSGTHDQLRLLFADELTGPWTEHPQSPLIDNDADQARPGGKVIEYQGEYYRLGQDCAPKYGNQLRAYRITELSREAYQETPVEGELVLEAGSHDWNRHGMHHLDAHQLEEGKWWAVVDGHKKTWILGWTP